MTLENMATPTTVHLHLAEPGQLLPVAVADHVLAPAERVRFDRWLSPLRKREFLTGRAVARMLLEKHGLAEDLSMDESGRPRIPHGDVSIAHSNGWVLCAVTQSGTLGVDVEQHAPRELAMLNRFFSDGERAWMGGDLARLHRLWTLKEAALKALGCGVSGNPARLEFDPLSGSLRDRDDGDLHFHPFWLDMADVSVAAVMVSSEACVTTPQFTVSQNPQELQSWVARDGTWRTRKTA